MKPELLFQIDPKSFPNPEPIPVVSKAEHARKLAERTALDMALTTTERRYLEEAEKKREMYRKRAQKAAATRALKKKPAAKTKKK